MFTTFETRAHRAPILRTVLVGEKIVTVMDVETLQLEVECLLTSSDVDQLSEVGYVLKMGKETLAGLSKLKLLKQVLQKLEEVIEAGNPEDNVELLNELKEQL